MTSYTYARELTKRCTLCRRVLPLDGFSRDATRADGYTSRCRACRNSLYCNPTANHLPEQVPEVVDDCRTKPCLEDRLAGPYNRWSEERAPGEGNEALHRRNNEAKNLCMTCPVLGPCRTWALGWPDPCGGYAGIGMIAGGLGTRERARIRRAMDMNEDEEAVA